MVKRKNDLQKDNQFFGWLTVSSKGQVAIPSEVRNVLQIKEGDKLLMIIRKDKDGINLIKSDVLGEVFEKLSK
ncbi:AbrB/MazE/SpoVT family DNA-binding domain-containing protein [Patescibacteria group bacterium]|nr:AbrB/MazE/SpoVT family DNA-binding domain-containing protein [Patescibacteria group bacterium]MBU4016222.1 AbrB/MazE/SpoVT family DNA-binding domain-containing protein [Patescibacteria group bacterium]MBU4099299.1 AbrB/MazE/SpoVT family DNA-binding domain-containing protein [Patescibacteria group bacterium]